MTKDVIVSIAGTHIDTFGEAIYLEDESLAITAPGSYFQKDGKHYLFYEEFSEDLSAVTKNRIRINNENSVEIMKTGYFNATLSFEKGVLTKSYYDTPVGKLLLGIKTHHLKVEISPQFILLEIDYELDLDNEPYADCKIIMEVKPKLVEA